MNTLALVPARSGSEGLPGKNIRDFCGKPLMAWAIDIGLKTCNSAIVSTDTDEYAVFASRYGAVTIHRPPELARDDTPTLPVVQHALDVLRPNDLPDVVVLLQPTAPLRTKLHVLKALTLMEQTGADSVVSVVEIPGHYHPERSLHVMDGQLYANVINVEYGASLNGPRRQDCEPAYTRDGTVYVTKREVIEAGSLYGDKCVPLIIPANESCNIDTEEDWQRAEGMMRARQ